ncbi:MAG: hypothetical protein ACNS64_13160 [Candidatus Halalkalibacterium sp. M3_1C_030]
MATHGGLRKTGRAGSNALLWVIEMAFKILAPVAAAISLGDRGGFFSKVGSGLASLPEKIRELVRTLGNSDYVTKVINDYNSLTAAEFNEKYGSGAINNVMQYLNEGVSYLQNVYQNLSSAPVSTLLATLLVFLMLYLASRLARFIRQRGQGSVIDKMERKAGEKIFRSKPE